LFGCPFGRFFLIGPSTILGISHPLAIIILSKHKGLLHPVDILSFPDMITKVSNVSFCHVSGVFKHYSGRNIFLLNKFKRIRCDASERNA